jgi:hypothetical protein
MTYYSTYRKLFKECIKLLRINYKLLMRQNNLILDIPEFSYIFASERQFSGWAICLRHAKSDRLTPKKAPLSRMG